MTRSRLPAAAAALTMTGGAAVMLGALVADPGPWWQGYVSEAGTAGQPYAVAYRWGLVLLALGVAFLAGALRRCRRRHVAAAAAGLAVAAVLAGISGVVPCSDGCPLPPYEPTTRADVVHTAASILGMAVLAGAMAAIWLADLRPAVRRLAAGAAALVVPVGAGLGLTMLLIGRGTLSAVLERLLLVVAVGWLVGTAALTAATGPPGDHPRGGPGRTAESGLYDDRMTDQNTPDQLRQELKDIDEELAELRRVTGDAQSRRGEDGDDSQGFQDPEDVATELTGLNETEAVIDVLEQRRERVEAQLKGLN